MTRHEFTELLIFHGLRRVGDEWHGVTPAELAERYSVPEGQLRKWCGDWQKVGYYVPAPNDLTGGYLTAWGRAKLKAAV